MQHHTLDLQVGGMGAALMPVFETTQRRSWLFLVTPFDLEFLEMTRKLGPTCGRSHARVLAQTD